MEATDGKWIVEVSELRGIGRHRVAALKDFLSKTYDEARMPYAYKPEKIARGFVIIGTTNEMEDLRGAPENRRVWPVYIQRFDLVRLRADRDQLWAEAVEAEALGESICLGAAEPDKL
jgi:predicted P-loop ATPase